MQTCLLTGTSDSNWLVFDFGDHATVNCVKFTQYLRISRFLRQCAQTDAYISYGPEATVLVIYVSVEAVQEQTTDLIAEHACYVAQRGKKNFQQWQAVPECINSQRK